MFVGIIDPFVFALTLEDGAENFYGEHNRVPSVAQKIHNNQKGLAVISQVGLRLGIYCVD